MMMKRRHQKYSPPFSKLLFRIFKIGDLHNYGHQFDKKRTAENRYQEFLANHDGKGGNDSANCQTSRVTHKHLGWIRIIPQKADAGSNKSPCKYHEFTRIWY